MSRAVVFYVNGHGFGHATRASALLDALRARLPDAALVVRSGAPARFFPAASELGPGLGDPGLAQRGPLDVDLEASLAAHESALSRWESEAAEEAGYLRARKAALVLCDAPALACEAAARAGVPAAAVSNFSWDWILEPYAADEPRWAAAARRYAGAYSRARLALLLPGGGGFESVVRREPAPLLARRAGKTRAQARAALGLPEDGRRWALVSFGGFGVDGVRGPRGDFPGWRFLGFGPAPAGLESPWTRLENPPPRPHAEVVAACDAIVCKPGYGTFAEAAAHGTRVLYVHRPDYREARALVDWIGGAAAARELPRARFESGDWGGELDALMSAPAPAPPRSDGAEEIALRLAQLLD